ncbi:MAG: GAF domain-containing protein [Verrucomicrobia bacterium]|jgi:GAF domain-containing protein|nr:GAF domain-containing protein [Verrucomicrobiota bacterium]
MKAPRSEHEAARLQALRRYHILDTAPERAFNDIIELASFICHTPIAFMSLVAEDRQWFKAAKGIEMTETPRDDAFCAHTILESGVFIVEDARKDHRFANNPLVEGHPGFRFYAGAPLVTREGHALGSLCAVDLKPHHLDQAQIRALEALARTVVSELELRRVSLELQEAAAKIKTLHGLLPICSYCKGVRDDAGYWQSVEAYVERHSDAHFTHGICPKCFEKHYPELARQKQAAGARASTPPER